MPSARSERATRFLRNKGGPPGGNQSPSREGRERRGGDYEFISTEPPVAPSKQRRVSKLVQRVKNKTTIDSCNTSFISDWIWGYVTLLVNKLAVKPSGVIQFRARLKCV